MKMALRFSFWTTLLLMMTQGGQGRGNPSDQLQRAQTLNGQWTTNAVQTAPSSGVVEFHGPSPPSDRGFYRAFQE